MYEWIVYKTTNQINGHIYIGVHKSPVGKNDGYIGNDIYKDTDVRHNTPFHRAVKKYGYKNFKRETLFIYPYTEEGKIQAFKKEAELVNRDFLKRHDVYNACLGGKIPSSINEKEVAQYDLDGKFIASFYSIAYAAAMTDISKSSIQHCCSKLTYSGQYQWRYYTGDVKDIEKAKTIYKTVYQFDLNGNYIGYYKSLADAGKAVGTKGDNIGEVCKGTMHQCCGYFWSFKKQFSYEEPLNKNRAVACYDDNGKLIKTFTSLRNAAKEMNLSRGVIVNSIKGKSKHAGKLRWRYFSGDTSDINPIKIKI